MSIDLSLDRLKELSVHLPPYTRPTIHVAGTNGKGSVSAILTSILLVHPASFSPLRIGRFNSPHLVTVLDCITLDNVPISRPIYDQVRAQIEDADRRHATRLSNFELLTLTALQIFEREKVDVVVLEVGMGGRLDATNIVPTECILVSALTAVDLDHQAFLGDTVTKIAKEKAGIARPRKPFVLGRQPHAEVREVVAAAVKEVGAVLVPALEVERDTDVDELFSLASPPPGIYPGHQHIVARLPYFQSSIRSSFPLHGDHQLDNLGTALAVIDAIVRYNVDLRARFTTAAIEDGIRRVSWPGRLSFHNVQISDTTLLVLADGAHNRASAETLAAYITMLLDSTAKAAPTISQIPITFILGLSHSPPKTPQETLAPLFSCVLSSRPPLSISISLGVALLPFSPPEGMPWVAPVPLVAMRDAVAALAPGLKEDAIWIPDEAQRAPSSGKNDALKESLGWTARRHGARGGLVVLAGSLYLVADFYRFIGDT